MKKVRVMIIEDSPVITQLLTHIINSDPRLEVAAAFDTGEKALENFQKVNPDVISMDIRLPGINGFKTTQKIMSLFPKPIVVVSASVATSDLNITMNALKAGALSVVEKPVGLEDKNFKKLAKDICDQLYIMSEVKVITQRIVPWADKIFNKGRLSVVKRNYHVLGIASSTGGPNALLDVLNQLTEDFRLPILLVQHITTPFLDGFINWLSMNVPFDIVKVDKKTPLAANKIYVAQEDRHLVVDSQFASISDDPPLSFQRPSATVLFNSMSKWFGASAVGLILTGMGDDGAAGLKELRLKGGYTIAEDQTTAIIYGMPKAAVEMDAVCESLPLNAIGRRIFELTSHNRQEESVDGKIRNEI